MCSNTLVEFVNIQNFGLHFNNPKIILIEYIVDEKLRVSVGKDYVGLVPKGINLSTFDINELVTHEFVIQGPVDVNERRYKMEFSLIGAKNLNYGQEYMFFYSNIYSEVFGVSKSFKFMQPTSKENLSKHETNNNEGEESPDDGLFQGNIIGRNRRVRNTMPSRSGGERRFRTEETARNYNNRRLNQALENKGSGGGGDLVACQGFAARSCSNCKRMGHLFQIQSDLYIQVKNLAEKNKDLELSVSQLQQQLELGQAAYQKVCVQLMREREIRLFYLEAPRDTVNGQMAWSYLLVPVYWGVDGWFRPIFTYQPLLLYGPSVSYKMVIETLPSDALVPVNRGEKRMDDKTKLRMKAIMGRQEEKIRMLTEKIKELESALAEKEIYGVTKVKAVIKDIGELSINDKDGSA